MCLKRKTKITKGKRFNSAPKGSHEHTSDYWIEIGTNKNGFRQVNLEGQRLYMVS